MKSNPLSRLDTDGAIRERLLPHCRLKSGDVWHEPQGKHRMGCFDVADSSTMADLTYGRRTTLAIHDLPDDIAVFQMHDIEKYIPIGVDDGCGAPTIF